MYENLATLTIFGFCFSVVAGRIERSSISGPMVFIAFGLIAGPYGMGFMDLDVNNTQLRVVADLTLALVLFIDAANADLKVLRSHALIPRRMLLIGLPLTILLGIGAGVLIFPSVSLFEICILATMLAATDAALGKAVVNNKAVPAQIREGLNAESGLNDGMCVPVLLVFLALATGTDGGEGGLSLALQLVAREIGIGIAVAVVFVVIGIQLIKLCAERGWFTDVWVQLPVVTLALACFATAQSLHGSGYIAAFVGGLLFGHLANKEYTHKLVIAGEGIAELLAMFTWIIFGAAAIGQSWAGMTADVVLYSVLSLTVIRMLPNVLALSWSGEKMESKMFLAWFGPRGLASIVFFVIVASEQLPSESLMQHVVVCTITLCVVAHGITANFWARGIGRRLNPEQTET
jgi:NhaP-type Na+/H+ or K+/H+ antiporter